MSADILFFVKKIKVWESDNFNGGTIDQIMWD